MNYNTTSIRAAILKDWNLDESVIKGCEILYYEFITDCDNGSSVVILSQNRRIYIIYGTYGEDESLYDQWDEEEVSKQALLYRLDHEYPYPIENRVAFRQAVEAIAP